MSRTVSFASLVVHAFGELWLHSRSVTVGRLITLTFFWGALLIVLETLFGMVDFGAGASLVLQVGTLVFFMLMTATWLTLTLKQTQLEVASDQSGRELAAGLIAILPTIAIAALLTWAVVSFLFVVLASSTAQPITDFTSCEQFGGIVVEETNPRQCITDRKTFVEPIPSTVEEGE